MAAIDNAFLDLDPESLNWTRMKAYILIEALMGKAGTIVNGIRNLRLMEARLVAVDAVTGPFDVVVVVETTDLETLIRSVTDQIQEIDGVQRTITCVAQAALSSG